MDFMDYAVTDIFMIAKTLSILDKISIKDELMLSQKSIPDYEDEDYIDHCNESLHEQPSEFGRKLFHCRNKALLDKWESFQILPPDDQYRAFYMALKRVEKYL